MKKFIAIILAAVLLLTVCACAAEESTGGKLEGSMTELATQISSKADVTDDVRQAFEHYSNNVLTPDDEVYWIGTADLDYTDSAVFVPMMSSVAFQMVLLRMNDGADIEAAKQTLKDNANPQKWVCVEPEKVLIENVGDVIIYIMGEEAIVDALYSAAQSLAK